MSFPLIENQEYSRKFQQLNRLSLPFVFEEDFRPRSLSVRVCGVCVCWLTMACNHTGDVAMANKLINKMKSGQMKFEVNVIDCTQLIQAMTKNSNERRDLETTMEIVKFMYQHNIEFDDTAYICLLTACSNVGSIEIGKQLHQRMMIEKRIKPSITLNNALITMYDKCGNLTEAITLFNSIPKEEMEVISWNSLSELGMCGDCVDIFVCVEMLVSYGK